MDSKIAAAVGLAAVLAAMLAPMSTLTPAFAADVAADVTPGSASKTTDAFSPNPLNVKVGDTVTWTNKDTQPHTVTSGTGSDDPNSGKEFDSSPNFNPLLAPQKTFSHKFETAGEFPYYCGLHPAMKGTVVVASGGEPEPEPEPTPQEFTVTATSDGKSYEISGTGDAHASGATIQSGKSVTINFDKAGNVELTMKKDLISGINSVKAGSQELLKDDPTVNPDGSSTVSFTVPEGTTSIVITGETVVPEFPVIAAILVASIAGIIGFSRFAKSGTGFFGRA